MSDAIAFAVDAHRGQRRKDHRTPYIVHPIAVLRYLTSDLHVRSPDLLAAAVLHDTLEDTRTSRRALARRFGARTAHLVAELTIPPEFHGPSVPDARKTAAVLAAADRISWEALLVKLADRRDNLGDMTNAPWGSRRRRNYVAQTIRLAAAVRERWTKRPPPRRLAPALGRALRDMEGRAHGAEAARPPSGARRMRARPRH